MELKKQNEKKGKVFNQIPEQILENKLLNEVIKELPENYNFEIHKSIWRIEELKKQLQKEGLTIILQLPQGLQMFASRLSDIFEHFTNSQCIIIADENYGACCIEDLTGFLANADFIIHYGHSCLVPIPETKLKAMYVFVDIMFDVEHLVQTIQYNFPDKNKHIFLMGVIQFNSAVFITRDELKKNGYNNIIIPQERPRCGGEVLGCTSPILEFSNEKNTVIFVADGKFHMEGAMIANPKHKYYKYHPYEQKFILEEYDFQGMIQSRKQQINLKKPIQGTRVGIIQGILGRQGNPRIVQRIEQKLIEFNIEYDLILISEIFPDQLALFQDEIDVFVQIACPRLSIDWGTNFKKPLFNPYEFFCWIKNDFPENKYSNDFYSNKGGEWTNYYHKQKKEQNQKKIELKITQLIQSFENYFIISNENLKNYQIKIFFKRINQKYTNIKRIYEYIIFQYYQIKFQF